MTMAQGGLFDGNEESTELFTFAANGQSQSKEAKYHRAYRSDPKNNDRINSQKKRRRALKKESELGRVSSMFESVAPATKPEPQTVEKVLNRSDKLSLSNQKSETSCKSDSTVELINVLQQGFAKLDRNFDGLQSEIRHLKENVKPTAPTLPLNQVEQQTDARDVANPSTYKLSKATAEEQADKPSFLTGIFGKLSKLDGGAFITNFPAALVLGFCAYHACLFVAEQTVPLYESLQFPNPQMACYGAIGIAVGFSALSAISRSELIRLFTAVIIAYEVLIVWSGSQANQKQLSSEALRSNPTHFSISETYDIAKTDYEQKKARYEDKNSEVFHNGWFKGNHLDPAKKKMDEASVKLVAVESELGERYQTDWMHLVLKALYRISAVALVMLLAKESIKRGVGALESENGNLVN